MLSTSITWSSIQRSTTINTKEMFVSVRQTDLLINSNFHQRVIGFSNQYRYVLVQKNDDNFMILLTFLSAAEHKAMLEINPYQNGLFELRQDGGKKGVRRRTGFIIGCYRFIQQTPWLKAIADEADFKKKRFAPISTERKNVFVLACIPGFVCTVPADSHDIDSRLKGIYRYKDANGTVLYIGQGNIKARFADHKAQKDIPASTLEYTSIPDLDMRLKAESFHLQTFVGLHGRLPKYNKILGHKTEA